MQLRTAEYHLCHERRIGTLSATISTLLSSLQHMVHPKKPYIHSFCDDISLMIGSVLHFMAIHSSHSTITSMSRYSAVPEILSKGRIVFNFAGRFLGELARFRNWLPRIGCYPVICTQTCPCLLLSARSCRAAILLALPHKIGASD